MKKTSAVLTAATLLFATSAFAAGTAALPKGYEKWEKSKEKVVSDKSSLFYGVHYIYVDKKAMPVYKAGKGSYPEGSQFVVDYYKLKEENGKAVKGKKNMVVLMKKDKKFKDTGGWQFVGFTGEGKLSKLDPVTNCFECHVKEAKATDYVISKYADFK